MRGLWKNPVFITYGHGERYYRFDVGRMTAGRGTAFSGMGKKMDTIEIQVLAKISNDPEAVVRLYAPDAILLGTVSPVMSVGTEAIRKYFSMIKGSGNKNAIQERHAIVLGDNAVVVTGFYEFTRMQEGKPVPGPSRFTMLITRSGGEWFIAHHHSSPLVPTKK